MRAFSYRQGDRSEYLALYALTRLAFVTPVPRQEDFGVVDFRCILTSRNGNQVIPRGAFHVQVKSEGRPVTFNADNVRWLSTNMDCPLFICMVDRNRIAFHLFSALNLWTALFFRMHPQKICLVEGTHPQGEPYVHRRGTSGDPIQDEEGEFDVYLGEPVLDVTLDNIQANADQLTDVLDAWIRLDRLNVALMRLGRAASVIVRRVTPNAAPVNPEIKIFNRPVNQHGLLDKIGPLLESLRTSYLRSGNTQRAQAIGALMSDFQADAAASGGDIMSRLLSD
jgi:hypothetical protein